MREMKKLLEQWSTAAISLMKELPQDILESSEIAALQSGSLLRRGADNNEIDLLKERLGVDLPRELVDLLKISDGFLVPVIATGPAPFLSTAEIAMYKTYAPKDFARWSAAILRVGEDEYELGNDPNDVAEVEIPRYRDLDNAIALTPLRGGVILLMYPVGEHGGRWHYMKLSSHTKTYCYGSLGELLTSLMSQSLESLRSNADQSRYEV